MATGALNICQLIKSQVYRFHGRIDGPAAPAGQQDAKRRPIIEHLAQKACRTDASALHLTEMAGAFARTITLRHAHMF
jgi:hypothetical protein